MFDYVAAEPLEVLRLCRCCLRQSPEKNLKTPYTYDGKMEIYMDMLKDSLDIHLDLDSNECGICSVCVARLRDASDFKLQVQRSQAELRSRLERAERIIGEETVVKSELADDCDDFILYYADEEPLNNSYSIEDSDEDSVPPSKDLPATLPALLAPSLPAAAVKQLAMSCSVSLERVDVARVAHPCRTCHRTFLDPSSLERHMKDDSCHEYTCDTCGRQFKRKSSFEKHVQSHMTKQRGVHSKNISDRKDGNQISLKKISDQKDGNQISAKRISDQKESCKRIRSKKISEQKDGIQISSKKISDQKEASNRISSKKISDRKRVNKHVTRKRSPKLIKNTSKVCDQKRLNKLENNITPFTCKVCNKKFAHKNNLNSHSRLHTKRNSLSHILQQKIHTSG